MAGSFIELEQRDYAAPTSPYHGVGGRRPRAGRPPELAKQLSEAKKLAKQLQTAVRTGLLSLAENYPALLEIAMQLAKNGDTKVLLHLLELPAKMGLRIAEDDSTTPTMQLEAAFRLRVAEPAAEDWQRE